MKVRQVISKSRDGNRMEVIAREGNDQRTLHIHQKRNEWRYFAGEDKNGKKIFLPITV